MDEINKAIDNLLAYDGLTEAEKITGKYSGEDEATVWLGMVIQ